MHLNIQDYRNKTLGCWLGKNVGGTLGAPFEWQRQVNNVTFYTQKLDGGAMPNDDLDIQLLWLIAMEEMGIDVTARRLAEYWCTFVTPHWSEYGNAKINMRQGLLPPLSGTFRNLYKHSCGAFIRAEIWACIAPGLPHVAARYAYEDAILDHGNGEGTYAEIFIAALESAAFVVADLRQLIAIGLSHIPADCGVAQAVHTTLQCFDAGKTWRETRDEILGQYRGRYLPWGGISAADRAKGFETGTIGYDVPSNIAITLIGLLYGGADFGKVQCTAVNCGEDTDCTAATAGSIWGIIHGANAIPQQWLEPLGRGIKTICLNLGDLGHFGAQVPPTVDNLTERTYRLAQQVLLRHGATYLCNDAPTNLADLNIESLKAGDHGHSVWGGHDCHRYDFDMFRIHVDYTGDPLIRSGEPKSVKLIIQNRYKTQANLTLHWYLPDGWTINPGADAYLMLLTSDDGRRQTVEFQLTCPRVTQSTNRAVVELTIAGRPTVMHVPVVLLNGNVQPVT